jgi:hypothetical protein
MTDDWARLLSRLTRRSSPTRTTRFEYLRRLTTAEQIASTWAAFAAGEIDEATAARIDAQLRRRS